MSGRSGIATCALGANPSAVKRGRRLPFCLLLIAILLGAAILQKDGGGRFPSAHPRSNAQWAHLYAALPLRFEANRGQTDPSVSFLSRGRGYALFLTRREAVLTLSKSSVVSGPPSVGKRQKPGARSQESGANSGHRTADDGQRTTDAVLRLQLVGANPGARVTGADELPGKANYFIGNDPGKWHTDIPTYAKVRYEGVYPGIDLVYYGARGGELEYDFVVAPGADPHAIALDVEAGLSRHPSNENGGVKPPLQIAPDGDLVIKNDDGEIRFHKPVVYQPANNRGQRTTGYGQRTLVEGNYVLQAHNQVGFEVASYDHHRPLVIDPVLAYATYVGGSGGDIGYSIQVDSNFDAYIAGVTNSSNFPTLGAVQGAYRGNGDAFVTKINSAGTKLIYSTYLGGSQSDTATALALSNGSVFITGYTSSSDFPVNVAITTPPTLPFQQTYGGGSSDAFVAQLNTTGNVLVYSSYLGGSGADFGQGIAVDSSGNAYVTGSTQSTNFPITNTAPNTPYQPSLNGSQNAFVTKVNFSGEALIYSTYLGGSSADSAQAIQLDSSGNAYIAGYTFSSNFPTVAAYQSAIGGGSDAFVSELNAAGSALTFSTFLGGSANDYAYGLALDSSSSPNIYVTGATVSTNFPTTTGSFQPALAGSSDAFVCKFNNAGSSLLYSTYLGGTNADQGNAIAVTSGGVAFVTGYTQSTDFPTLNAVQAILGISNNNYCGTAPCADAFVTQLNAAGNALTYSTYLGGNGPDFGQGIAVDNNGDPYITGSTSSTNFPVVSPPNSVTSATAYVPPYKSTLTGTAGNAFIAKIDSGNNPNISIEPGALNFGNETVSVTSTLQEVIIVNPSTEPLVITQIQVGEVNNSFTVFTETDNCVGTIPPAGAYCTMYVGFTPEVTGSAPDTIIITDNAGGVAGTEQQITLTGSGVTAATAVTLVPTSLSFSSQGVGTVSAPQNVTLTNTGTQPLTISQISTGTASDFTQTNTCGAVNNTLAVNQSCTVSVSFSPVASGTRSGALTISDNATGSPQSVTLTGIGAAAFTLASPTSLNPGNPALIGVTQDSFVIVAKGDPSFTGTISLACYTGFTCAFNPPTTFIGGPPSTLTISNLPANPPSNPYTFTVTGTSGSQSSSLPISVEFEDFTLTPTPLARTIQAGGNAPYNILINPLYGFNSQIQLACTQHTLPQNATCTFTPTAQPTPNGTTSTQVALSISTVKYVPITTHVLPRLPNGKLPPLVFGLLCLAGLASLGLGNRRRARTGWLGSAWLGVRLATLSLIMAINLALAVACRAPTLAISGTPTGGYSVQISGTLMSNTVIVRYCTVALGVTQTAP
ncbi:MAG TPA: SBBP repeat-containing protein [Terriglobia bacterium]|nr:SBBP repeat-containing protein [Terriglobia bacterium]